MPTPLDTLLDCLVIAARRREHAENHGTHGDSKIEEADAVVATFKASIRSIMKSDRLDAVEALLEEVAALHEDEGYQTWQCDDVVRDRDGKIITMYGTKDTWHAVDAKGEPIDMGSIDDGDFFHRGQAKPYIIGEV